MVSKLRAALETVAQNWSISVRQVRRRLGTEKRARTPPKPSKAVVGRRALVLKCAETVRSRGGRQYPAFPSTRSIRREVFKRTNRKWGKSTIHRDLLACGATCRVRPLAPAEAGQEDAKRKAFCATWRCKCTKKDHRGKCNCRLRPIVFSDEHHVNVNDSGCRTVWGRKGKTVLVRRRKNRFNVASYMVWAAFGQGYKSPLVFFPRQKGKRADDEPPKHTQNAANYVSKCLVHVRPLAGTRKLFMQDGAPSHRSKRAKAYLQRQGVDVVTGWPAHSPDLNPCEEVWALLDAKIAEKMPDGEAELKAAALESWDEISQTTLNRFARSFYTKVERCFRSSGQSAKARQH
jgi:transposase